MKKVLSGIIVCFSMYSRIPVPQIKWTDENMRWALGFLPLVGAVVGGVQIGWYFFAVHFHISPLLYAAVAAVLPILLTGGIHVDGYMDTCDALFSYGDRDKKLMIMKDPHTGAFAVIYGGVYFLLMLGLFSQLYDHFDFQKVFVVAVGYIISRCVCGLCVAYINGAKSSGLVYIFQNGSDKKRVRCILWIGLFLSLTAIAFFSLLTALFVLALQAMAVCVFVSVCKKQFGGITGDLAGFVLQLSELMVLVCAVIAF